MGNDLNYCEAIKNKKGEGRCPFTFLLSLTGNITRLNFVAQGLQSLFGNNY